MSLQFFSEDISFRVKSKTLQKKWIENAVKQEGKSIAEVNYVFCSDKYLLQINRKYLKHNYFTDIITFQYKASGSGLQDPDFGLWTSDSISGDIFISIDRVKENSKTYGVTFDQELHRVMIHGILHLLGYNDKSISAKKQMTKREDFYLHLLPIKKTVK